MTRIIDTRPGTAAVAVATAAGLTLAACGSDEPSSDAPTAVTATDSSIVDTEGSSAGPATPSEAGSGSVSGPESVPAGSASDPSSASGDGTPEPPPAPSDASSAPVDASVSAAPTSSADPTSSAQSPAAPRTSPTDESPSASVAPGEPTPGSAPGDGDSGRIEAIECDGGNYLAEITPMTVNEAAGKIEELRRAHPDASFGHFTEPCGPADQLVIYWNGPSDATAPLLQQRRELEAPRIVVLQLDPQRPGYLDTGLCDLQANGEPPTLRAGDDLDRNDKNWLFELTSYLGDNGLIHPDHGGITEIDEMVDAGIRSYQGRSGLAADGVVGSATWQALNADLCSGGTPELKPIER